MTPVGTTNDFWENFITHSALVSTVSGLCPFSQVIIVPDRIKG